MPAPYRHNDLREALRMMGVQLVEASLQVREPELVRRQHLIGLVRLQLAQRVKEVAKRVRAGPGWNDTFGVIRGST